MQSQIQELVCYIWDNYLQISESAQQIFLLGVGNAYLGVKVLLVNRGMYLHQSYLLRPAFYGRSNSLQTANLALMVSSTLSTAAFGLLRATPILT